MGSPAASQRRYGDAPAEPQRLPSGTWAACERRSGAMINTELRTSKRSVSAHARLALLRAPLPGCVALCAMDSMPLLAEAALSAGLVLLLREPAPEPEPRRATWICCRSWRSVVLGSRCRSGGSRLTRDLACLATTYIAPFRIDSVLDTLRHERARAASPTLHLRVGRYGQATRAEIGGRGLVMAKPRIVSEFGGMRAALEAAAAIRAQISSPVRRAGQCERSGHGIGEDASLPEGRADSDVLRGVVRGPDEAGYVSAGLCRAAVSSNASTGKAAHELDHRVWFASVADSARSCGALLPGPTQDIEEAVTKAAPERRF